MTRGPLVDLAWNASLLILRRLATRNQFVNCCIDCKYYILREILISFVSQLDKVSIPKKNSSAPFPSFPVISAPFRHSGP